MRQYHVYILASKSRALYVGVTRDLVRRVAQHRCGVLPSHARAYRIARLVHYEAYADVRIAIAREKELKGWRRSKKVRLIEARNPAWRDLAEPWLGRLRPEGRTADPSSLRSSG